MGRSIRTAIVLLASVAALLATAAPASAVTFHSEIPETKLSGAQSEANATFFSGGVLKCTVLTLSATLIGLTAESIEFEPSYSGCTAFGQASKVEVNGCRIRLNAQTLEFAYVCVPPNSVVIKVGSPTVACTITIERQLPINNVIDITNQGVGKARDLLVKWTVGKKEVNGGVRYTTTGGICGPSGTNGTIFGTMTIKGFNPAGEQVGIFVE